MQLLDSKVSERRIRTYREHFTLDTSGLVYEKRNLAEVHPVTTYHRLGCQRGFSDPVPEASLYTALIVRSQDTFRFPSAFLEQVAFCIEVHHRCARVSAGHWCVSDVRTRLRTESTTPSED